MVTLVTLGLLLAGGAAGIYAWLLADLPPVSALESHAVRPTTRIEDRNGRLLYEVLDPNAGKQFNLSLAEIPPACQQATIATEDSRFYLHPGVDPIAIARATLQNARSGAIVSGASTLTQQLARILLLDADERLQPSYQRKLREAWLAWRLDSRYTKDELLALYLNQSYYGNFAFGIEAAAQIFFAKPAAQLSQGECALLAGLIQYPGGYNPLSYPDVAKARQQTVLRLMQESGYLTAAQAAQVEAEPLRYRSNLFEIRAPHFVMYVQDQLARELGPDALRAGGLTVTTTLDLDLQQQVQRAVNRRLDLLNCRTPGLCDDQTNPHRRIDNAAAVVLDSHTGEILAMVGSPDYFDPAIQGNVNAALSLRQPGSAIKPLTYAAALDPQWSGAAGVTPLTPATILADLPTTFYGTNAAGATETFTPLNYDRAFHGPVSVRTALASSYNIPAVKVLERIGVTTLQRLAAQAGISSFTRDYGLALTLGGGEVRLLELTAAFGVLDDGVPVRPQGIMKIEDRRLKIEDRRVKIQERDRRNQPTAARSDQSSIFNLQLPKRPVISPGAAYLITDILADSAARQPAFGAGSVLELPFAAAVKTGTTTDWRDNWTIGYSSERIAGVWVGNADNTPMIGVSGVDGAGPIWHDVMLAAHPQPSADFTRPPEIIEAEICGPSGLLPTPECTRVRRERFIAGSEPTQRDDQFQRIAVDRVTGAPATSATPATRVIERTYWLLPPEYHAWMASQALPIMDFSPADLRTQPANIAGDPKLTAAQLPISNPQSSIPDLQPPITLASPVDRSVFQLHPGQPPGSQRIEVRGYTGDTSGETTGSNIRWAELRLMVNGAVLATAQQSRALEAWWTLEPGEHVIWIEGEPTPDAATVRSARITVSVAPAVTFEQNVGGK